MWITKLRSFSRGSSKIGQSDARRTRISSIGATLPGKPSQPKRPTSSYARTRTPQIPFGAEFGLQAFGPRSLFSSGWWGIEKFLPGTISDARIFMDPPGASTTKIGKKPFSTSSLPALWPNNCGRKLASDVRVIVEV